MASGRVIGVYSQLSWTWLRPGSDLQYSRTYVGIKRTYKSNPAVSVKTIYVVYKQRLQLHSLLL